MRASVLLFRRTEEGRRGGNGRGSSGPPSRGDYWERGIHSASLVGLSGSAGLRTGIEGTIQAGLKTGAPGVWHYAESKFADRPSGMNCPEE